MFHYHFVFEPAARKSNIVVKVKVQETDDTTIHMLKFARRVSPAAVEKAIHKEIGGSALLTFVDDHGVSRELDQGENTKFLLHSSREVVAVHAETDWTPLDDKEARTLDMMGCGITVINGTGTILFVNKKMVAMLGAASKTALVKTKVSDFAPTLVLGRIQLDAWKRMQIKHRDGTMTTVEF